jgi:type VI secretion system protein VasG
MKRIIRLKLGKVVRRVWDHYRAKLRFTDELVDTICSRCTEVDTGARNVDHILTRTLLPEMSSEFLSRMASGGSISAVEISVADDGSFAYTIS